MSDTSWSMMVIAPVAFLLVCLVGSLRAHPLQRVDFSSCENGDFKIRCNNLNESILVQSAIHSVADLWHCRNCASGCMGDQTYGRYSFHSDYGWTLGSLCNGRNLCRLDKWCGSDCVETFNVTYFCVGNEGNTDMTGQLPTPPPGTPEEDKQDVGGGSVANVELQRAHLSRCTNQSFDIGCSDNSSIIILSVDHSVADRWNCPSCNSTCMGDQVYSQHEEYYSHHTYRSHHRGHHSHRHTYHYQHHTYRSPGLVEQVSALCNGRPRCTIDKWCGSDCVETYNITYYCVNSTNIGTTCWKPGSPDYAVLRRCPVRINPTLRPRGSPTTQVTITILTPYRNHFTVCRWSDRTCRQVTTHNTTLTGGFSILPAGHTPVILQLDYHIKDISTTASAGGSVQQNAGKDTSTTASAVGGAQENAREGPILSVTSIDGINTGQRNPAEGVRASAANAGLGVVDIVGIVAAMVVLLLMIIVVAVLVTYYKRHCIPSPNANLKRKPVVDNVYITGSVISSSTGTTDTDWITVEDAYNQRYRYPGSPQQPPLPPRHY